MRNRSTQRHQGQHASKQQGPELSSGRKSNLKRPESYTILTDDGPELRPELVDDEARDEATNLRNVTDTQLRRFFGAAKADEMNVNSPNQAKVAMALLKAKAHYTAARDRKNRELADFLGHHVKMVATDDDYRYFIRHFEAVIAYHKFNGGQTR